MKNFFTKKSNILTLFLLGLVLWKQGPQLLNNFKNQGTVLKSHEYEVISGNGSTEKILFPPHGGKAIAVFWATWCGPCKVEMQRLKSSVEHGEIPAGSIVLINPFEKKEVVKKFLKENSYPFTFIEAPGLASLLGVESTPTTIFLENETVTSMSTGISFFGIWKAEAFL